MDFIQKVSLKVLNKTEYDSFSDLVSDYLHTNDPSGLKLSTFCRHNRSLKNEYLTFRILEIFTFNPCIHAVCFYTVKPVLSGLSKEDQKMDFSRPIIA